MNRQSPKALTNHLIPIFSLLCLIICSLSFGLCYVNNNTNSNASTSSTNIQPEVSAVPLHSVSILEVANVTNTESPLTSSPMITESQVSMSTRQEFEFKAQTPDPYEVISSSEILDNQQADSFVHEQHQDVPTSGGKQEPTNDNNRDKHSRSQYQHNSIGGSSSSSNDDNDNSNAYNDDHDDSLRFVGTSTQSSSSADETSAATTTTTSQQLISRYLLQSLTLGLLILVSLSLALIYSLKFCLCRKRKLHRRASSRWPVHLLRQHNLISDASASINGYHHSQAERLAQELLFGSTTDTTCTCLNASTLRAAMAAAAAATSGSAPTPPLRYQSLLAPNLWAPSTTQQSSVNTNPDYRSPGEFVYQQLALAERLAIHNEQTMLSPMTNRPPTYSELFNNSNPNHHPQQQQQQQETPLRHQPPGNHSPGGQESLGNRTPVRVHQHEPSAGSPLVSSSDDTCDLVTTSHNLNTTTIETSETSGYVGSSSRQANETTSDSDDHCDIRVDTVASSSTTSGSVAASSNNCPRQSNLLVKLNLNKTRLLSPEDLVLLSKLIDVPIMVQEGATIPTIAGSGQQSNQPIGRGRNTESATNDHVNDRNDDDDAGR